MLRPRLPKPVVQKFESPAQAVGYRSGAVVNAAGFSHPLRRWVTLPELIPLPMLAPEARLALTGEVPAPRKALPPLESKTENGSDDWKLVTPLTDHPLAAARVNPVERAKNGSSYT